MDVSATSSHSSNDDASQSDQPSTSNKSKKTSPDSHSAEPRVDKLKLSRLKTEDEDAWSSTSLNSLSKILPHPVYTLQGMLNLYKTRRKRKELMIEQKVALINESDKLSQRKLALKYDVGKTQVGNIMRRKNDILRQYRANKFIGRVRAYVHTGNEEVNLLTWQWYQRLRDTNIPVTGAMCQQKAREFALELRINDFKGSNGWLQSFRKRHNLIFTTKKSKRKKKTDTGKSEKLPEAIPNDVAQLLHSPPASSSGPISVPVAAAAGDSSKQMPVNVIDSRASGQQPHMELPPHVSQMQPNNPEWTEWNKFIDSTFNEMAKRVNLPGPQPTPDNYRAMAQNYTMAACAGSAKDQAAASAFRPSQGFTSMHDHQLSVFPTNQRPDLMHDAHGLPSCQISSHMESYPPTSHVPGRDMYAPPHGPLKELYPPLQHSSLKDAYQQQQLPLPHGHVKEAYGSQHGAIKDMYQLMPHPTDKYAAKPATISKEVHAVKSTVQSNPNNQPRPLSSAQPANISAYKKRKASEQAGPVPDTLLSTASVSEPKRPAQIQLDNLYDVLRVAHQLTLFFRRASNSTSRLRGVYEKAEGAVRDAILAQRSQDKAEEESGEKEADKSPEKTEETASEKSVE